MRWMTILHVPIIFSDSPCPSPGTQGSGETPAPYALFTHAGIPIYFLYGMVGGCLKPSYKIPKVYRQLLSLKIKFDQFWGYTTIYYPKHIATFTIIYRYTVRSTFLLPSGNQMLQWKKTHFVLDLA